MGVLACRSKPASTRLDILETDSATFCVAHRQVRKQYSLSANRAPHIARCLLGRSAMEEQRQKGGRRIRANPAQKRKYQPTNVLSQNIRELCGLKAAIGLRKAYVLVRMHTSLSTIGCGLIRTSSYSLMTIWALTI
jgi:hypothetical protein